jgi:hypothetical protein
MSQSLTVLSSLAEAITSELGLKHPHLTQLECPLKEQQKRLDGKENIFKVLSSEPVSSRRPSLLKRTLRTDAVWALMMVDSVRMLGCQRRTVWSFDADAMR